LKISKFLFDLKGFGRSPEEQGLYQLAGILLTVIFAIITGLITGSSNKLKLNLQQ
jgi:hypothetical protein